MNHGDSPSTEAILNRPATAFDGHRLLKVGPLQTVALAAKRAIDRHARGPVLVFDDGDGKVIDLNLRGSGGDMLARLTSSAPAVAAEARGPGRPKLGVVAREVTLLPRHWAWLSSQPGGASVALRKLVEDARRTHAGRDKRRHARESAYAFMSAIAGDLPGFEDASRALFADDAERFFEIACRWPRDVAAHAQKLGFGKAASKN